MDALPCVYCARTRPCERAFPSWHAHRLDHVSDDPGNDDIDDLTEDRQDAHSGLPAEDIALLDLEDDWQHGRLRGDKGTVIHDRLEISSPRYHQRLNVLLDDPRAALHAPALVNRLRRVRQERRTARSADQLH
ncbi:DUF3263 domain-containing protein [Acidipropionibacterium jensenii]|nr:DUF3263 domain-containing protein [Acidipropionibacterium jensenii]